MTFAQPDGGLGFSEVWRLLFQGSINTIYIHSINEKEEEEEDIAWSDSDSKRVICKLNVLNIATENYTLKKNVNILKSNWKLILKGERKKGEDFPMSSTGPGSGWGSLVGAKKILMRSMRNSDKALL